MSASNKPRVLRTVAPMGLAALLALGLTPHAARSQEAAARPEIGRALEDAGAAIRQGQFDAARAKLAQAQSVQRPTPYESAVIDEMRGALAQATGDTGTALEVFQRLLATRQMPQASKARMEHAVAALAFGTQDYATAADFAARAIRDGDTDPALPLLISQAAYASGDYGRAYSTTLDQVQALRRAGRTPSQAQLQMLAAAAQKQGDDAAYGSALEALATSYPDPSTTEALFARLQGKPEMASRYAVNVMRLKRKLGLLTTGPAYEEAVQLALSGGYSGEAASLVAEAYARGAFGSGPQAARQQRLRAYTDKQLADDQKGLSRAQTEAAAARDGQPLVRLGYDMVMRGDASGVALVQQGLQKGGTAGSDQAKLTLGEAYAQIGRVADAAGTFAAVNGNDGSVDLAHIWLIALKQGS